MTSPLDPILVPDVPQRKRPRRKRGPRLPLPREYIRVTLTDVAHRGYALGRCDDGRVVLAAFGIPGEEVIVEVTERHERYLVGRVVDVLTAAPTRVDAPCQYYERCGGCQWQHVEYAEQLRIKERIVRENLRRIGKLPDATVLPAIASDPPWGYRNQVRFTVWWGALGFVGGANRRFVRIDECLIADPKVNELIPQLQDRVPGAKQVMMRVGTRTGDILLQPSLAQYDDVALPSGQKRFREKLMDAEFSVAASSFFQVNTPQAETLIRLVGEGLALGPDDVFIDAYAGVGTFARLLAPDVARVIAIEESASAVDDMRANLGGLTNVEVELGTVEVVLPRLERASAVLLDPPRAGCHRAVLDAIIATQPPRVAYVSCEPATLARDLAILVGAGYELVSVQPVDMFPQTYHIECVAILRLAPSPA